MRELSAILLLLLSYLNSNGQDNSFVFSNLKEKDGLSDNIINCFFKDSRGILWIGTYNGFNSFDGSNFFVYKKRKGTNSMANEVVHSLCEDKHGNIWGSGDNGVFCFKPAEDSFINYNIKSYGIGKLFYKIFCDRKGNIWAAGEWSVFKFDAVKNKFDEVVLVTKDRNALNSFQIRKNGIQPDPARNGFWMATRAGIFYYDADKNTLLNFSNMPGDSLFARRSVSALSLSPSGAIWFFNNDEREFISFDPASRKILQRINISHTLPNANGGTILEDKDHRLWFASVTYESLVVDIPNGNRISLLNHRPEDSRSIPGQFFWSAMQDDDGTIWLGTNAGIGRCNPEKTVYKEYGLPGKIPGLKETSILLAEEDPLDKSFWFVTRSSLLIHYSAASEKYESFDLNKSDAVAGNKPGACNAIHFSRDQIILTTNTGAWQLKRGDRKISPYTFLPTGFENFRCNEMVFGGDSVIYFTDGRQLLYWNYVSKKNSLINYLADPSIPTDKSIISGLMLAPDQTLWMNSYNNHIAFRNSRGQLQRVKVFKDDIKETGVKLTIDAGSKGEIWLLNKGVGLYSYNPASQSSQVWDETDGLPSNRMQQMKVDHAGRVWNVFYNKISVFIPGANRFYNFQIPISEGNTNYNSYVTTRSNGNILSSIDQEIVEFFPARIDAVPGKNKPRISMLNVNGNDLHILNGDKIILQSKQNTIRFSFGSLTDKSIFPYDMEYRLEGATETWTTATGKNEALYNNLAPGTYTFRVRAKGKNNAWQTDEAAFLFTIKTPFYKTTWFLFACILFVLGVLFFFYRYRLAQREKLMLLESKAQMLEKEKAMVMYESLKEQLNPHFLFNSLTSLNSLIESSPKAASGFLDSLSKTYRYILKSRDNDTVSLGDEIKFAANYVKLQQTRFEKGFEVEINVPEELYHRKIVPVTLQNLIENAIKHNIIDEEQPLQVRIITKDDYLVVQNNLQRKKFVETSNKQGLANLESLYRYLSNRTVEISETEQFFTIKIPLL
ncbi:MAG TPA: histidine kinase [Chitinophagaceae bacterium]